MTHVLLAVGASRGAGREIALAAGDRGANVIVVARGSDDCRKTSLALLGRGVVSIPILADEADLGDAAATDRVLGGAWKATGSFPTALLLATPSVRAGSLGTLKTLVRRGAQKSVDRVVVIADDPRILEELETALEGVPRKVEVAAIASGGGPEKLARAIEALGLKSA